LVCKLITHNILAKKDNLNLRSDGFFYSYLLFSLIDMVVFIASKEYDNLGLGYMASVLAEAGYKTRIVDFSQNKAVILRTLKRLDPLVVGFSVIFQYHLVKFIDLITYLRKKGVCCHFTAGGHYASLKYEELFTFIPSLDSIVRFEGEYTMLKLINCISQGRDWKGLKGLAYINNNKIIVNPPAQSEKDLDRFPYPLRPPLKKFAFEIKFSTLLAGRGCVHNCSFCNTRNFFDHPSGFIKRIRKPEMVVNEMEYLWKKRNCSIFLFLDDDFPVRPFSRPDWIIRFCNELQNRGMAGKILWRISCRPDDIDEELFNIMKRSGLFLVFLGIEDGTDSGLQRLNKNMTSAQCLHGISILKKMEIGFDYGFLLFNPWSGFKEVNNNLDYLKQICCDGFTSASFLKLMPYYETRVENELLKEGRLKFTAGLRDYDFLSEPMNRFFDFVQLCFHEWLNERNGIYNLSRWTRNYFLVYSRLFGNDDLFNNLRHSFTTIIAESNMFLISTLKDVLKLFASCGYKNPEHGLLTTIQNNIEDRQKYFRAKIENCSGMLYSLALKNAMNKILNEGLKVVL